MGSLIKRLVFLFSQGPVAIFVTMGVFILLIAMLLRVPSLLLLLLACLPLIYYIIVPLLSVRPKQLAAVADDYIQEILNNTSKEFCLILRPFGVDGDTIIHRRGGNSWLSKLIDIFAPLKIPTTVEQVIVKVVKEFFNCETVALVDPGTRVISNSPRYLAAESGSWQLTVDLLLRRTLVAFLILHPQKQLTSSVKWEVDRVVSLGLVERFVIVLPPPDRANYMGAYEALKQLDNIFPALQRVPTSAFVVLPCSYETVLYWFRPRPRGNEEVEVNEALYSSAINQCLVKVKNEALSYSYSQKYPYWSKRIKSIKLERNRKRVTS
jgi:hypothetical protein